MARAALIRAAGVVVVALVASCSLHGLEYLTAGPGSLPEPPIEAGAEGGAPDAGDSGGEASAALCPPPALGEPKGLVAYYPANEAAGAILTDCTGNGYDGVIERPVWTTSLNRSGLEFSALGSRVDLKKPIPTSAAGFTVAAWVLVIDYQQGAAPDQGRFLVAAGDPKTAAFPAWTLGTGKGASIAAMELRIDRAADAGPSIIASASNQPGKVWLHLAAVYEPGKRAEVWLRGQRSDTAGPDGSAADPLEPGADVRVLGKWNEAFLFRGIVDELRFYDRPLSGSEIAGLAN